MGVVGTHRITYGFCNGTIHRHGKNKINIIFLDIFQLLYKDCGFLKEMWIFFFSSYSSGKINTSSLLIHRETCVCVVISTDPIFQADKLLPVSHMRNCLKKKCKKKLGSSGPERNEEPRTSFPNTHLHITSTVTLFRMRQIHLNWPCVPF